MHTHAPALEMLSLPQLLAMATAAEATQPRAHSCAFGAGAAAPQTGGAASSAASNFTCTPPAVIGNGSVTIEPLASAETERAYFDAQIFTYRHRASPPPRVTPVKVRH